MQAAHNREGGPSGNSETLNGDSVTPGTQGLPNLFLSTLLSPAVYILSIGGLYWHDFDNENKLNARIKFRLHKE